MPIWTGKKLNKVTIGELVARGGMAEVYVGDHATLNRKVAVKIMRDHMDGASEARNRFEREARVMAGMRHQNIIQVYDYDVIEDQPCLVMEYMPGASLGVYLKALHQRGEKLPFDAIAKLIKPLAAAIDYAHSQNIVHRDIKPANVLLRSASGPIDPNLPLPADIEPILSDFGLVRLLDASIQTSTGAISGTPAYMSPEQARGDAVDSRTDIYSLGVMLYEMLAGGVPFESESSFGLLMKHLNEPPPHILGLSSDLQAVIDRALAKDPARRYATATDLANEFIAVFSGQTVSVDTSNQLKLARQAAEKKDRLAQPGGPAWLKLLGALLLIGVLAAAGFALYAGKNGKDKSVAQARFTDFNNNMDKLFVSTSLEAPPTGMHYEVWLLSEASEVKRDIGSVSAGDSGHGQLTYVDAEGQNILSLFDQIQITLETDQGAPQNKTSGTVVASLTLPAKALVHIRHLLVAFSDAPDKTALIQGLWFGADQVSATTDELQKAFEENNEELVRRKTEEIINQLVGRDNATLYKDWDGNGTVDNPGDGYGLLSNGEPGYSDRGYIPQVISHANFSISAPDASPNIQSNGQKVIVSAQNMQSWAQELLNKAQELQNMPYGDEMAPLIAEIHLLADRLVLGEDKNGNQTIEPLDGEGGADTAYESAYDMALMQLLSGARRTPPTALP
ncbi:MAG: protein kinase [Anaerolineales bacterium]|nr:protein kinase [Anaerolineales bacterium]